MARLNCDYLVTIEWMRYSSHWIPNRIVFVNPYDNSQVAIRPSLDSLQSFTYQDVVQNLKCTDSLYNEDDDWKRNDIIRVPVLEFEDFLNFNLLKDYLQKDDQGWDLMIGATDRATYMYLDRFLPNVVQYVERATFRYISDGNVKILDNRSLASR
ncbi:hypothetical protein TNCV_3936801 [Trichonephila clavipes]|nr:hypothetical protein TNCV_3936801 [Trichonephila clavipes]